MPDLSGPEGGRPVQLGILGGGQLGLMMAHALDHLQPLLSPPVALRFFNRSPTCPVTATPWPLLTGSLEDDAVLGMFSYALNLVTYESENTPVLALQSLISGGARAFPGVQSLTVSQDRLTEKDWLNRLGIPTAPYAAVSTRRELHQAVDQLGLPGILKTRRFGYDGKGQAVLRSPEDLDPAWLSVAAAPCVYEAMVPFVREVSQISVRAWDGSQVHYPLTQNHHEGGILRHSLAPAPNLPGATDHQTAQSARQAQQWMEALLPSLDHVGTLALELFELADGSLVANEMAPRVHNSGHWTIEGTPCSQFENHLRAGLGLPLGPAHLHPHLRAAEMINLIGQLPSPEEQAHLQAQGWILHDYGKKPAPGRKVGHATQVHPA